MLSKKGSRSLRWSSEQWETLQRKLNWGIFFLQATKVVSLNYRKQKQVLAYLVAWKCIQSTRFPLNLPPHFHPSASKMLTTASGIMPLLSSCGLPGGFLAESISIPTPQACVLSRLEPPILLKLNTPENKCMRAFFISSTEPKCCRMPSKTRVKLSATFLWQSIFVTG